MSRVASSRLLPRISALSLCTATPAATTASSSSPTAAAAAASASEASSTSGDPSSHPPPAARKPWGGLKFAAFATVTAAAGATGYASYAYSLEELDQMTREFRKKSKLRIPEDASSFEKFQAMAYSAAMKVPVATIEGYLDLRSQIEDQIRGFSEPVSDKLLPDRAPQEQHVLTLVLDLNETLVYSDWKYVDPVVDRLDPKGNVRHRLSRVATKYEHGKHYRM
nr:unnamed protein product [Digitaria exilis]